VNIARPEIELFFSTSKGVSRAVPETPVLDEPAFHRTLSLERRRSERSRKPILLMLVSVGGKSTTEDSRTILGNVFNALRQGIRETDVAGWYEKDSIVGVLFTEVGQKEHTENRSVIEKRFGNALRSDLGSDQFDQLKLSFYIFPDDWNESESQGQSHQMLYPEARSRDDARKAFRLIKRAMDIVGGIVGLTALSPVFLIIALAIKVTSKGPVFYRQSRIGQHGIPFAMVKFRSMRIDNNSDAHREYVTQLIAGVAEKQPSNGSAQGVYKLTSDDRITPVGAFLRRTSLDELPQLLNVLKGEMSLVGPRPPIDYEVERYDLWHRRRLMEAKPGITGLWQVAGRNRIPFDDMVRLDLIYAQSWTPWLDFKILLRTPRAVIEGAH